MKLYNYDYSDIIDISFSYDTRANTKMTSKVYPTKLEIKVDEEANRPFINFWKHIFTFCTRESIWRWRIL